MSLFLIDFENVHDSGISGISYLTSEDEVCIFYSQKSEHMSFDTHVNIMKADAKVQYIKLRKSAKNALDFQLVTYLGFLIGSKVEGPFYIISKDTGFDSVVDYWKDHGVTVTRQPSIGYGFRQLRQQQNLHNIPLAAQAAAEETEAAESVEIFMEEPEEIDQEESEECAEETETVCESPVEDTQTEKDEESFNDTEEEDTAGAQTEQVLMKPQSLPESYRKKVRTVLRGKGIPSGNYAAIYKAIVNSYDKLALNNLMVKSFGSSKGGIVYNAIRDIFTEYHSL